MSPRPTNYNTKQGDAVLSYLAVHKDEYVTIAQIEGHFKDNDIVVSRTTIYRQLEKLAQEGKARKHTFERTQGACFRYVEQKESMQDVYHLKCEMCGEVFNLKCKQINHVSQHILESHAFQVNDSKIVFFGKCGTCLQNL